MKEYIRTQSCWRWLIRFIGLIERLRADWRQEWEAELHCRKFWRVNQFSVIGQRQIFEVTRQQTFALPRSINRLPQLFGEPFARQRWQGQRLEMRIEWNYVAR